MDNMPETALKVVKEALAHPNVTGTAISEILHDNDYKVSEDVVQRHRRGVCPCFRHFSSLSAAAETGDLK